MKKNYLKLIPVLLILLALCASVIWTYNNLDTEAVTISYIADILIITMLFIVLFYNNKVKRPRKYHNYQDWITEGTVEKNNRLNINIFSLEDLVKLAIDLDKRVIHDTKLDKYYTFAEDIAYIYDPSYVTMMVDNKQQIGKLLLDRGLIRPEQLEIGLYYQKRIGSRLGDSLIALGFIDETTLYSTLAAQQRIAYYELDAKMEITDTGWLGAMSVNKARALQVLPVGRREDGKLVIACGESALTGITTALQEMFGKDIYIVAVRPSRIYEILERIEIKIQEEKEKDSYAELLKQRGVEPYERLSENEYIQFMNSYFAGKLDMPLFIKAIGLVSPIHFAEARDQESLIGLITSKNLISGEIMNLINSLRKLVKKLDASARQNKVIPELLDMLKEAYYITDEAADWISKEAEKQKKPLGQMMENNYLVSGQTIGNALMVLGTLKKTLYKAKIY
jgi:hypothetical protein